MKYFEIISDENKKDYEKYKYIRGEELYEFVAKYCYENLKKVKPSYNLVREIIKYYKRIKNVLYIFFGTFEDYLKAQIYSKTIYSEEISDFVKTSKNINQNEIEYFSAFNEINSTTRYSLNKLIDIVCNKQLLNVKEQDLKHIKNFRNQVLHFNFVLFGQDEKKNEYNLKTLKENILLLKKALPKNYGCSLIADINKTKLNVYKNLKCEYQEFFLEELK